MDQILVAENIVKNFGSFKALDKVSLEVPKGSIFGLLGPNGAGKTTFIRIINQITMPDEGRVFFDGNPLALNDVLYIGYLPEERGLYKRMKIGEQALYLAQLMKTAPLSVLHFVTWLYDHNLLTFDKCLSENLALLHLVFQS